MPYIALSFWRSFDFLLLFVRGKENVLNPLRGM